MPSPVNLTKELKQKYDRESADKHTFIDPEIQKYIQQINSFEFIRTTQCCQGHASNGYLSVMLEDNMVSRFENEVFIPLIRDVADKRYENMHDGTIIIRYLFQFEPNQRDEFFQKFITKLNGLAAN
jgi:hypothetical protein